MEEDKLHFTRTDNFPDPYEGTLPDSVLENIEAFSNEGGLPKHVEKDEDGDIIFKDDLNHVRTYKKSFFHNCWNYKDYESKPMWDNKSTDGEAVAIMTTAERLRDSFDAFTQQSVYIGLVEYGDYDGDFDLESEDSISMGDWKTVHLHKPIEFEEENELRATVPVLPTTEADPINDFTEYSIGQLIDIDWTNQPDGVKIPIDKDTLIQEVRLSPYADDWQKGVIEEVLESYDVSARVSKSEIFG